MSRGVARRGRVVRPPPTAESKTCQNEYFKQPRKIKEKIQQMIAIFIKAIIFVRWGQCALAPGAWTPTHHRACPTRSHGRSGTFQTGMIWSKIRAGYTPSLIRQLNLIKLWTEWVRRSMWHACEITHTLFWSEYEGKWKTSTQMTVSCTSGTYRKKYTGTCSGFSWLKILSMMGSCEESYEPQESNNGQGIHTLGMRLLFAE